MWIVSFFFLGYCQPLGPSRQTTNTPGISVSCFCFPIWAPVQRFQVQCELYFYLISLAYFDVKLVMFVIFNNYILFFFIGIEDHRRNYEDRRRNYEIIIFYKTVTVYSILETFIEWFQNFDYFNFDTTLLPML